MDDESFGDLSADAGELGAGHHATALYEVRLADGVEPGTLIGLAEVLWKTPGSDEPAAASAQLCAADPEAPMPDSLALATAVADLAGVVKGYGPYGEPAASLYDVRNRAIALQQRDVPGASELVELASRLEYLQ
jgi:hypothetical protein